ncbi:MAG: hypothetical protein IPN71_16195 [Fibrobacteres bacterium]|nr:hypothetical protein [Fibrobacterota bacterium]
MAKSTDEGLGELVEQVDLRAIGRVRVHPSAGRVSGVIRPPPQYTAYWAIALAVPETTRTPDSIVQQACLQLISMLGSAKPVGS